MLPALCLGIESRFKGQCLHSREYRDEQEFRGKRVLVIGIGNTGGDLSVELSHVAAKVQLHGVHTGRVRAQGSTGSFTPGSSINSTSR